ncbi:hypothetical protein [Flavobacterium sp.]|uniref:hypothetical protein n=1 Tax=Flavobacterium sp. TaxID=239 RepID=UPI0028BEFCDD|nr:hypothetical protein [Flavobacterium sp.]
MKNIKIIIATLFLGAITTSCLVDDEVESENLKETPMVVGFNKTAVNFSYFEDLGSVENDVFVEIIGGGLGFSTSTTTATFEIDPSSTATEGQEFSFPNGKNFTIDANHDLGSFKIAVNTGSLNPTNPTFVKLNIVPTGSVVPANNKKSITIEFVGCNSEIIPGNYANSNLPGSTGGNADIDEIAPNTFETVFPVYTLGGQLIYFVFNDTCGNLSIVSSDLDGTYLITADDIVFDSGANTITFTNLVIHNGTSPSDPPVVAPVPTSTYTLN